MLGIVLSAVLLASAADGEVHLDDDPDFKAAVELYQELEFEQAIFRLERTALSPGHTAADRALILTWLGLCFFQSRQPDRASIQFELALRNDPDVVLPEVAPPSARELFAEARARNSAALAASPAPNSAAAPRAGLEEPATAPSVVEGDVAARPDPIVDDGADLSVLLYSGAAAFVGVGVVSFIGAGAAAWMALPSVETAQDPEAFQDDAIAAAASANTLLSVSAVAGGLGALAVAAGAALGGYGLVAE